LETDQLTASNRKARQGCAKFAKQNRHRQVHSKTVVGSQFSKLSG
jgi:hypothetical protein